MCLKLFTWLHPGPAQHPTLRCTRSCSSLLFTGISYSLRIRLLDLPLETLSITIKKTVRTKGHFWTNIVDLRRQETIGTACESVYDPTTLSRGETMAWLQI